MALGQTLGIQCPVSRGDRKVISIQPHSPIIPPLLLSGVLGKESNNNNSSQQSSEQESQPEPGHEPGCYCFKSFP